MPTRHILMVVSDLFFATRIAETARTLGVEIESANPAGLVAACRARRPDLVVLDLMGSGDPIDAVRALRADAATESIEVVGFYPHVEDAVRQAALAARVTQVLPRSAFTKRLSELLTGERPRVG